MQGSKLYVGNLSYAITTPELQELFAKYGTVKETNIIQGKGFGFVEMSTQDEAVAAKQALNNFDFQGRQLRVDEARPMKKRSDRGGGGGGFRGGYRDRF
jgi:RNA recognition motif-containing protein